MVLEKAEILLVSELDDKTVSGAHLTPAHSAEEALDKAYTKLGNDAKVLVMPYGGSTLPCVD